LSQKDISKGSLAKESYTLEGATIFTYLFGNAFVNILFCLHF
jgi:hypothetical protein